MAEPTPGQQMAGEKPEDTKLPEMEKETDEGFLAKPKAGKVANLIDELFTGTAEKTFQESSYDAETQRKPYNPDDLWQKKGNYDIYRDMVFDDQVSVCMDLKKDLVLSGGWDIVCEGADDQKVKEDLEVALGEDPEKSLEDMLEEVLSAYEFGFSISEKIFQRRPDGSLSLKTLKTRSPETWLIHTDKHGNVTKYEQQGVEQNLNVNPRSIMHYVNRPRFQNPYGRSDLRAAYAAWFVKRQIIRFYGIFIEKAAAPTPVARYDRNVPQQAVDDIYESIKKLQSKTSLVIPKEIEMEFLEAKSNGEAFIKGINIFNMFIGRALMVPDLLGFQGGETSGGSYSLGKDQMMVLFKHIQRRRATLTRMVNKQLIYPIVASNHGLMDKFPKFRLRPIRDEDVVELAKVWLTAVKGGGYTPTAEELNHFRKAVQFPETSEDDQKKGVQVQVPGEQKPMGESAEEGMEHEMGEHMEGSETPHEEGADGGEKGPSGETEKPEGTEGQLAPTAAPAPETPAQNSALNGAQITSLLAIVQSVGDGAIPRSSGVQMIVTSFNLPLDRAEAIMGEVGNGFEPKKPEPPMIPGQPPLGETPDANEESDKEKQPEEDAKPEPESAGKPKSDAKAGAFGQDAPKSNFAKHFGDVPGDFHRKVDFKAIESSLDRFQSKVMAEAAPVIKAIYEDLYDQIEKKKIVSGQKADRIEDLKIKKMKDLKLILKKNLREAHQDAKLQAQRELLKGNYKTPVPDDKFLELLESESFQFIGDWAYNVTKGAKKAILEAIRDGKPLSSVIDMLEEAGIASSEVSLERYARTKFTEVMNRGRLEFFNESGVVAAYQYSAILDDRTSEICDGLHGKIFKAGDQPVPPMHFNCRSVLIPITKYEDWKADDKVNRTPIDKFIDDNKGDGFSRFSKETD